MNFSNLVFYKKHSRIKKQVMVKKVHHLLLANEYVLFFHYNGLKEGNWQQIKEKIYQRVGCKTLLVKSNLFPLHPSSCPKEHGKGADRDAPKAQSLKGDLKEFSQKMKKISEEEKDILPADRTLVQTKVTEINQKAGLYMENVSVGVPLKWPSLIKGPTLLVACSSAAQMAVLMETCKPPGFLSLGGVHKRDPINHLDIKQWAFLGNAPFQIYPALLHTLVKPAGLFLLLQSPSAFFVSTLKWSFDERRNLKKSVTNA